MYYASKRTTPARRGVILLVVIALLTLFAVVGITFVLYAQSKADIARIFRDSQQQILNQGPPDSGQTLLSEFLMQLIFDVQDTPLVNTGTTNSPTARNSALRGHSLGRNMFGYNGSSINTSPYSGIGRRHTPTTAGPGASPIPSPLGGGALVDEYDLVNYMWFKGDNVLHDPERAGWRATDTAPVGPFVGGANVSYTYPDLNNMFLAAVRADGTVLCPSYHRPWITRKYFSTSSHPDFTLNPLGAQPDPKWKDTSNPCLRYMTLRPRPADMGPLFPEPIDGGDVKNLQGAPGGNDSVWIDIGYPVQTLPDGRSYKPLFAALIVDLDNRVNLNVHGNLRGKGTSANVTHMSNQGWGPWEVNLAWVLNYIKPTIGFPHGYGTSSPLSAVNMTQTLLTSAALPPAPLGEWRNVLTGTTTGGTPIYGRYGPDLLPTNIVVQPGVGGAVTDQPKFAAPFGQALSMTSYSSLPPFYSSIDFDGANEASGAASGQVTPPVTPTGSTGFTSFPTIVTGTGYGNGLQGPLLFDELSNHPLLFNFYQPAKDGTGTNYDNSPSGHNVANPSLPPLPALADADMFGLIYNLGDSKALDSANTGKLCPENFKESFDPPVIGSGLYLGHPRSSFGLRRRMLVTARSFDLDQPAYTPWVWDRNAIADPSKPWIQPYRLPATTPPTLYPTGNPIGYPTTFTSTPGASTAGSDFEFFNSPNLDWRGNPALASPSPSYPASRGRLDLSRPLLQTRPAAPFLTPYPRPDATTGLITNVAAFNLAQADRQQMAMDIFTRLQKVTGAVDITNATVVEQYNALRWLAQLAANIVDYIDSDDIMTPFNWTGKAGDANYDSTAWVFGTELPRLVVNEVFAEVVPKFTDPTKYNVNFSIELHNPFNTDANLIDSGDVRLVQDTTNPTSTPIYQIVIHKTVNDLTLAANVLGNPDAADTSTTPNLPIKTATLASATATTVRAATGKYKNAATTDGFFVIAPPAANSKTGDATELTPATPTVNLSDLTYTVPSTTDATNMPAHAVLLRRLACPWRPHNDTPGDSYNPYVTVDYMDKVPVNNGVALALTDRYSYGRTQPYVNPSLGTYAIRKQNPDDAAAVAKTTFFRHNAKEGTPPVTAAADQTLKLPFFWLSHLDRQLVSPMELLEVSAFKPHALTHQFVDTTGTPYQHRAPWFDNNARIYRIFEYLETWNRSSGMGTWVGPNPTNGELHHFVKQRVPGLVNINTVWDPEVFMAVADPQADDGTTPPVTRPTANCFVSRPGSLLDSAANIRANLFNPLYSVWRTGPLNSSVRPYDPTTVFGQLLESRSPTVQGFPNPPPPAAATSYSYSHVPGPNDQPFMGHSFGAYPATGTTSDPQFPNMGVTGVHTTLLRPLVVSLSDVDPAIDPTPTINLSSTKGLPTEAGFTLTLAVDTGPNEEFITVSLGNVIASPPRLTGVTFTKKHAAGFGIGRLFAPIMSDGTLTTLTPPNQQHQLLNRLFNNVTTRSNVFAVWLTVGFFQVIDDSTIPNKLGAELGTEQGLSGSFRHRMFAIVDRTALCIPGNTVATSTTAIPSGTLVAVTTQAPIPAAANIQPGSLISIDGGQQAEIVMVLALTSTSTFSTLVFRCNQGHATGFGIATTAPGNPGPNAVNPLSNRELVPYFRVLD